jgi:hypothetical protein
MFIFLLALVILINTIGLLLLMQADLAAEAGQSPS